MSVEGGYIFNNGAFQVGHAGEGNLYIMHEEEYAVELDKLRQLARFIFQYCDQDGDVLRLKKPSGQGVIITPRD